jgi:hypothetical protein
MAENEQEVVDLAEVHSRGWLIEQGLQAYHSGRTEDATNYFGAAIRKARRLRYWDVEVEYYRFLTLFKAGDFSKAVQRCVICLDALHETRIQHATKKDLPYDLVKDALERALLTTMTRRGDSLMRLQSHLRKKHAGEFYLMKTPMPLFQAIGMAWRAPRENPIDELAAMRQPLRMISTVLLEGVIEDMIEGAPESDAAPRQAPAPAQQAGSAPAPQAAPDGLPEWLVSILNRSPHEITAGDERRICHFVAQNDSPKLYDLMATFLEDASDHIRHPYLKAFAHPPRERQNSPGLRKIKIWIEDAIRSSSWS